MKIISSDELIDFLNFTSASVATPEQVEHINRSLMHKWSHRDGICPYCKANKQCVHWDGMGWTRDKKEFSYDLPDK